MNPGYWKEIPSTVSDDKPIHTTYITKEPPRVRGLSVSQGHPTSGSHHDSYLRLFGPNCVVLKVEVELTKGSLVAEG